MVLLGDLLVLFVVVQLPFLPRVLLLFALVVVVLDAVEAGREADASLDVLQFVRVVLPLPRLPLLLALLDVL